MSVWRTPGADEALIECIEIERMSASEAASSLSRRFKTRVSRNAVIGRARRIGAAFRRGPGGVPAPKTIRPRVVRARRQKLKPAAPVLNMRDVLRLEAEPAPIGPRCDFPAKGCRWIIGDTNARDWRCCGHEAIDGPYCPHHEARASTGKPALKPRNINLPGWAA